MPLTSMLLPLLCASTSPCRPAPGLPNLSLWQGPALPLSSPPLSLPVPGRGAQWPPQEPCEVPDAVAEALGFSDQRECSMLSQHGLPVQPRAKGAWLQCRHELCQTDPNRLCWPEAETRLLCWITEVFPPCHMPAQRPGSGCKSGEEEGVDKGFVCWPPAGAISTVALITFLAASFCFPYPLPRLPLPSATAPALAAVTMQGGQALTYVQHDQGRGREQRSAMSPSQCKQA